MQTGEVISICIAVASLLFVILAFGTGRHDKSDSEFEEMKTSLLKCNMKLDQICATTNETRSDIKAMNNRITELDKELSIVKRDIKTAFERIDEISKNQ